MSQNQAEGIVAQEVVQNARGLNFRGITPEILREKLMSAELNPSDPIVQQALKNVIPVTQIQAATAASILGGGGSAFINKTKFMSLLQQTKSLTNQQAQRVFANRVGRVLTRGPVNTAQKSNMASATVRQLLAAKNYLKTGDIKYLNKVPQQFINVLVSGAPGARGRSLVMAAR